MIHGYVPKKKVHQNQLIGGIYNNIETVTLSSGQKIYIASSENKDSISIQGDLLDFSLWKYIGDQQLSLHGGLFNVVLADPPWNIQMSYPNRKKKQYIDYDLLKDKQILDMPLSFVQEKGFFFIWYVFQKKKLAERLIEENNYREIEEITWFKTNQRYEITGKLAKWTQRATEKCKVSLKGLKPESSKFGKMRDWIVAQRKQHSEKPNDIYEEIEKVQPTGFYLDLFSRPNNRRKGWVCVGNEVLKDYISEKQYNVKPVEQKH